MMRRSLRRMLAGTTSLSLAVVPLAARANPLDGRVTAGAATIAGENTKQVTITQSTPRAIIDWRTFNIAPGETTQFNQPDAASVTLNRVTGGLGASTINGMIKANGGVFVVNPDGFLFGSSAVVNTGSFLATTHNLRNDDFMAGHYNFSIPGNPAASIVNQGTITAASGGFASLVAPGVRNDGIISARLGTVALASGNGFTLDLYGDSLIKLQPSDAIAGQVRDVATGQPLKSLVQNTGKLKANGGTVQLTAAAARQVVDSVINSSGVIKANSVGARNGRVIFGAATSDVRLTGAPAQVVKVSGKISAAGKKSGTTGGLVQITGEDIQLSNVKINASGDTGGGAILIGGDYHGGIPTPIMAQYGITLQPRSVPNATTVTADSTVRLDSSARTAGNGGKVVVWSNDATVFKGEILAKGGAQSGDGGFAEVSGKNTVDYAGLKANLSAPHGANGTILFDPTLDVIDPIKAGSIGSILSVGTNVLETADEIQVNASILKTGSPSSKLMFASTLISFADNVSVGSTGGPLDISVKINPLPVADESNALVPILQAWRAAGLSPSQVQLVIINNDSNPAGAVNNAATYKVVRDLSASTPDSLKSSFVYKVLSSNSITVGTNVRFYTAGGVINIEKHDGNVSTFANALTFDGPGHNCSTLPCGQFFTFSAGALHLEWTDHITPTIINDRAIFNFSSASAGTTYNILNASTPSGIARLTSEFPSLSVSFGAAPGGPPPPTPNPPPSPTPTNPPQPPFAGLSPQQQADALQSEITISRSTQILFGPQVSFPALVTTSRANEPVINRERSFIRDIIAILDLFLFAGLPPTNPTGLAEAVVGEGVGQVQRQRYNVPEPNYGNLGKFYDMYNNVDAYIPDCSNGPACDTAARSINRSNQ